MMSEKCHKCKNYILEYAPIYSAYVEGCKAENNRKDGCKDAYEPKEKPKAYIRMRESERRVKDGKRISGDRSV